MTRRLLALCALLAALTLTAGTAWAVTQKSVSLNFIAGGNEDQPSTSSQYRVKLRVPAAPSQYLSTTLWESTWSKRCPVKLTVLTRWGARPAPASAGSIARELARTKNRSHPITDGSLRGARAASSSLRSGRRYSAVLLTPDNQPPNPYGNVAFHALVTEMVIPSGRARRSSCRSARRSTLALQSGLIRRYHLSKSSR